MSKLKLATPFQILEDLRKGETRLFGTVLKGSEVFAILRKALADGNVDEL